MSIPLSCNNDSEAGAVHENRRTKNYSVNYLIANRQNEQNNYVVLFRSEFHFQNVKISCNADEMWLLGILQSWLKL